MDYRSSVAQGSTLSQVNADALLLVLTPEQSQTTDPVLDALIQDAIEAGDLALKSGRALYLHRPRGVQAARLVLAVATDAQPKAFKAAVVKGLSLLKDGGAGHVAIAAADGIELGSHHARVGVLAAAESTYVFRLTKPSAPKAGALKKVTLLSTAEQASAVKAGIQQGQCIAEGVTLARELGYRPANHCTTNNLGGEASRLAKSSKSFKVEVIERPAL